MLLAVASAAAVALLVASPADAALPQVEHAPTKADGSLAILAVGDWGRRGQFNQTLVAQQVKRKPRTLSVSLKNAMLVVVVVHGRARKPASVCCSRIRTYVDHVPTNDSTCAYWNTRRKIPVTEVL
jgi:hypothetical protein